MLNVSINGELGVKNKILNTVGSELALDAPIPGGKLKQIAGNGPDLRRAVNDLMGAYIFRKYSSVTGLWVASIHPERASLAAYFRHKEEPRLVSAVYNLSAQDRQARQQALQGSVSLMRGAEDSKSFAAADAVFYLQLASGLKAQDTIRASDIWRVYALSNPLSVKRASAILDHHKELIDRLSGNSRKPETQNPYIL